MWVSATAALAVVGLFFVLSLSHELKVVFEKTGQRQSVEASFKNKVVDKAPSLGDTLGASVRDFLSIFSGAPTPQPPAEAPAPPTPSVPAAPRPSLPK